MGTARRGGHRPINCRGARLHVLRGSHDPALITYTRSPRNDRAWVSSSASPPEGRWPHAPLWGPAQARSCRVGFVLAGVSLGPSTGDKEGRLMATSCPKSERPSDSSGSKSPTRGHSQGLHATPLVCRARLARSWEGQTPSPRSPASPSLSDLGLGSWQWPCGPQGPQGNKGFWGHCPGPGLSLCVPLGMAPVPRGSSVCDPLPANLPTDPVCR